MKFLTPLLLLAFLLGVFECHGLDLFPGEEWSSGFLEGAQSSNRLFYVLFQCRNKSIANPPLLIWMNGGPGYSSIVGMYASGGPYIVENETLKIVRNPYAWNEIADTIFLEQPAGTGLSEARVVSNVCHDISCVGADFLAFVRNLYELHPKYKTRDLYIAGECYGGHYVPHIADYLLEKGEGKIPLKGYAVVSGHFDVFTQAPENLRYLVQNNLLAEWKYGLLNVALWLCKQAASYNIPLLSTVCAQTSIPIYMLLKIPNDPYDIQRNNMTDIYEEVTKVYMARKDVLEAFGVNRKFNIYNGTVFWGLTKDFGVSAIPIVGRALDRGIKVVSMYGDKDYMCSHTGGQTVAESIEWVGQQDFLKQPFEDWSVNGISMASFKKVKNLFFITVKNVGHCIFCRQRVFGLEIFKKLFADN